MPQCLTESSRTRLGHRAFAIASLDKTDSGAPIGMPLEGRPDLARDLRPHIHHPPDLTVIWTDAFATSPPLDAVTVITAVPSRTPVALQPNGVIRTEIREALEELQVQNVDDPSGPPVTKATMSADQPTERV